MSTTTQNETVVAAFHTAEEAQRAVHRLKEAGFTEEQIGVVSPGEHDSLSDETQGSEAGEGAAAGAATGLGVGAIWGLGIVAGMLPALGPVIAGGALAAVAASAAGTAAVGGLVGALVGLGVSEEEAGYYHEQFESGRTIVTVQAGAARHAEARGLLDGFNAYDYSRRDTEFATNAGAARRQNAEGQLVDRQPVR